MLKTAIAGIIVAAVCCFTPAFVIALGALGLGAYAGWIDVVALPAMVFFILLTGFTLWRRNRPASN